MIFRENVNEIIEKELGFKFKRVLEDAGVFKTHHKAKVHLKHL